MKDNIIVVGGGISGLVSALLLSKKSDKKIIVIEKDIEVGGLLKKFDYGKYGIFDYGAHNLLETGILELDKLLFSLLPEEEWEILDGHKREIAGSYFNGNLQKNSPYIDLRKESNYSDLLISFIKNIDKKHVKSNSLYSYFYSKYGLEITLILKEVVEKFYQDKIENLSVIAGVLSPLNRVILFDNEFMHELNNSDALREKLAYPEQRELDLKLSSGKRALYPKKYGMHRIIDALTIELKKRNVEILTDTYIEDMIIDNHDIKEVTLSNGSIISSIYSCIWSINRNELLPFLSINPTREFDNKKISSVILNLVVSKKLNIDDLYYVYGFSRNFPLFRITAYYNYCQESKRNDGYPISIEILNYDNDLEQLESKVIEELKTMGILLNDNSILFSKLEVLKGGFMHPSIQNSDFLDEVRKLIKKKNIKNLINIGTMSEENLFFQTDILIDLFTKVKKVYD